MSIINISIPPKLKVQAKALVDYGLYASFSDLVRDSIRQLISKNRYDLLLDETKKEERSGRAKVLKSKKDIDEFIKSI